MLQHRLRSRPKQHLCRHFLTSFQLSSNFHVWLAEHPCHEALQHLVEPPCLSSGARKEGPSGQRHQAGHIIGGTARLNTSPHTLALADSRSLELAPRAWSSTVCCGMKCRTSSLVPLLCAHHPQLPTKASSMRRRALVTTRTVI